jgi:hypothetical protein
MGQQVLNKIMRSGENKITRIVSTKFLNGKKISRSLRTMLDIFKMKGRVRRVKKC